MQNNNHEGKEKEVVTALRNLLDYPAEDLESWANGDKPITMTFTPWHIKQALVALKETPVEPIQEANTVDGPEEILKKFTTVLTDGTEIRHKAGMLAAIKYAMQLRSQPVSTNTVESGK